MHLYNLFLAVFWLIVGIALFIYDHMNPGGEASWPLGASNQLLAWLAIVLAAYNLVRGWSQWKRRQTKRLDEELRRGKDLARRDREYRESGRERDPNFIFDEPAGPEDR